MNHERDDLPDNFASWKHLLYVADCISAKSKTAESAGEIRKLLNSLDEHFPRSLNPLEDFRGYAVRQFCKSLSGFFHCLEDQEEEARSTPFRPWWRRRRKE